MDRFRFADFGTESGALNKAGARTRKDYSAAVIGPDSDCDALLLKFEPKLADAAVLLNEVVVGVGAPYIGVIPAGTLIMPYYLTGGTGTVLTSETYAADLLMYDCVPAHLPSKRPPKVFQGQWDQGVAATASGSLFFPAYGRERARISLGYPSGSTNTGTINIYAVTRGVHVDGTRHGELLDDQAAGLASGNGSWDQHGDDSGAEHPRVQLATKAASGGDEWSYTQANGCPQWFEIEYDGSGEGGEGPDALNVTVELWD